jgi:hypothetical protein
MKLTLDEARALLGSRRSPERRRAAKRLRELADPSVGDALTRALELEGLDPRTWETQYQMVMALGASDTRAALPLLKELALRTREATMVDVGLGDAITRLDRATHHDIRGVLWCAGHRRSDQLLDGAFRATAMLRLVPSEQEVAQLLDLVAGLPVDHFLHFWLVVAAAGWRGDRVERYLRTEGQSRRSDISAAAADSLMHRYGSYRPL